MSIVADVQDDMIIVGGHQGGIHCPPNILRCLPLYQLNRMDKMCRYRESDLNSHRPSRYSSLNPLHGQVVNCHYFKLDHPVVNNAVLLP